MKKTTLILYITLCTVILFSQIGCTNKYNDHTSVDIDKKVYDMAVKNQDFSTAIQATYQMLAKNPNNTSLLDSLLHLYFTSGAYTQSLQLTEQLLAQKPNNINLLEIKATSAENLGDLDMAINTYKQVYEHNGSPYYLYRVASLEYYLKRYDDCQKSINNILSNTETENTTIPIKSDSEYQDVSLKAAILNIQGVLYKEQNKTEKAMDFFEKALDIQDDFAVAQANLELVKS